MLLSFINTLTAWFGQHQWVVWLLLAFSVITFLASFVIVPWAIVRLPPDRFSRDTPMRWQKLYPGLRVAAIVAKNILGAVLLVTGIILAMPLVPGPGVFTILVGLGLLDLPGKRFLLRKIVAQPQVFASMNKLRAKHGQLPLEKP
jgi:hypothetical protein